MLTTTVFAGPSAGFRWAEWDRLPQITMAPPAIRGDIALLIGQQPPGAIVLADGGFDHTYAVSHREILDALGAGWTVIGVSSIGAIRAADLIGSGMTGTGEAFRYLRTTGAPDDHLALVHEPCPPYRVHAEALFDVAVLLNRRSTPDEQAVVASFCADVGRWWFCDRTHDRLLAHLTTLLGPRRAAHLLAPLADPTYVRAKQADLETLMRELATP